MKKPPRQENPQEGRSDLYLIHGEEFLVKERAQGLVAEILDPRLRDINLVVLDGSNTDLGELSSQLFTPSLFGGNRVVVVEQTTLFMSRTDRGKVMSRLADAWRSGDRKAALKSLGQLLNIVGVSAQELEKGPENLFQALDDSVAAETRDLLGEVCREYLAQEKRPAGHTDEAALEELILQPFPPGTTLIFTAADVDKRKKIFKKIDKSARVIECAVRQEKYSAALERPFFDERVVSTLRKAGKSISGRALDKMYSKCNTELRRLHSELAKLIGYLGDRQEVTESDVDEVVSDFHEAGAFDLNNAIRTGNLAKCLPVLHDSLEQADHPLQTLGAMAAEIRRLMVARELLFTVFRTSWKPGLSFSAFQPILKTAREKHPELMTKGKFQLLSMNDYALYSALKEVQKFPMDKLIRSLETIQQADVMMKSTRLGFRAPEALLEEVVFAVCNPDQSRTAP